MGGDSLRLRLWSKTFRRLPFFKGKIRLARFLLQEDIKATDVTVRAFDGSTYLIPSLQDFLGFSLFAVGFYEMEELTFVKEKLKGIERPLFLDIGANIGIYSITIAKALGGQVDIIAVEASPYIFRYLKENIRSNNVGCATLLNCAAYDEDNPRVRFFQAKPKDCGLSSMTPRLSQREIFVEGRMPDTIVEKEAKGTRVDLIKVDVEGYEAKVFKGARKLLTGDNAPLILFEFCPWAEEQAEGVILGDSQRVLKDFGYNIWKLQDYIKGKGPLNSILKERGFNLVAVKDGD